MTVGEYFAHGLLISTVPIVLLVVIGLIELVRISIMYINSEKLSSWKPILNQYKIEEGESTAELVCGGLLFCALAAWFMWPIILIAIAWFTTIFTLRRRRKNLSK